jgi:hypothetical protein
MESVQLGMGREVLSQAREMLTAERDSRPMETQELRWLASRLAESLSDALRVAESRGLRLPVTQEEVHTMTRSVMRYVPHTIRHEPEGGITAELSCAAFDCDAESGPKGDPDAAQDWALKHTGSTGHDLFRRVYTDHARVTREEQS